MRPIHLVAALALALSGSAALAQSTMSILARQLPADGPDGAWTAASADGVFSLYNPDDATALRYFYAETKPDRDRRVSVDLLVDQAPDGNGFGGLLFAMKPDHRHYYILALSGDGKAMVLKRDPDGLGPTMSTGGDLVKTGWNRVEIAESGDKVSLTVNGQSIGSIQSDGLGSGGIGIAAGGRVRAAFANFTAADETGPLN